MIGIYDCFGYGPGYDVPFAQRYKWIKEAGFDCVMLWWSDRFGRGEGYREDVDLARNAGLVVENMHTPVHEQNDLSGDDLSGESCMETYLQCVKDCRQHNIPNMVIHLPDDRFPLNDLGMNRLERIVGAAEDNGIQVSFENLKNLSNLALVMDRFRSACVGYCYDSCHHINYAPDTDLLGLYGDRLTAIHLHDNGGLHNQHQLPLDGTIRWPEVMKKIAATGYRGATTLEPMNWDYTHLSMQEFLSLACQRAGIVEKYRKI